MYTASWHGMLDQFYGPPKLANPFFAVARGSGYNEQ
jgi:hypothetical protein